jgi:dTDP-4-dehydrorhamnose reductase
MKVFIAGASGLVGGNVFRHLSSRNIEVLGSHFSFPTKYTIGYDTLNMPSSGEDPLVKFSPDWIVHCGALTWVDYCEEHPLESYEKTVRSTKNLVEKAKKIGAKMLYISSDYVFDGENGPYIESDELNPLSVYGRHKLEAETHVLEELPDSLSLRITNVYGDEERNKNFVSRLIELSSDKEERELKLPVDQYATPINAYDVARCIGHLITENKSGIYHLASTDFLNRMQLAQRVLSYFPNEQIKLSSVFTSELKQAADRPLMGGLIAKRFLDEHPNFKFSNLDDYLKSKSS